MILLLSYACIKRKIKSEEFIFSILIQRKEMADVTRSQKKNPQKLKDKNMVNSHAYWAIRIFS